MKTSRRSFFGLVAGAVAMPFAKGEAVHQGFQVAQQVERRYRRYTALSRSTKPLIEGEVPTGVRLQCYTHHEKLNLSTGEWVKA